ncbi:hypothetical protein [Mycolicibacterium mengxianglii]|uniref:hypothetical protein n=1 Tax=Mycolicibacterium mengxianglii TaxID=2736649 RepID=UPI001E53DC97|nr:hypothetical protein [Mycolicibacterium mengxianglii]
MRPNRTGLLAAAAIATVLTAGSAVPGPAAAEPPPPAPAPADTTSLTLGLRAFGINPMIALYGVEGVQTVTIPVPPGLEPAELTATAILPVNVRGAILEIDQEDRVVSRVVLPDADESPVTLPLTAAEVINDAITVEVRSFLRLPDGYCVYNPNHPLRLINTAVRYAGDETPPTTVADFLPPVLEKLTLFLPTDPTRTETDAAIRLATSTAVHYGPQFTDIDVVAMGSSPIPPPRPLERQIVIRESDEPGVRLDGTNPVPALVISGAGAELNNQARLLSSDIVELAVTVDAVAGPLPPAATVIGDVTTIRELGQPGFTATSLVNPQVTVVLDQTRIGRPVQGARVHLLGTYTPLPTGIGGLVVVRVGDDTIDSWPTDGTGRIDRWVDIPDRLIERYTNLVVGVDTAGNTGLCGEFQPVTLTIDGETVVSTSPADPPIPDGFGSLPQALMPRIEIGVDEGFDNTRRAVQLLVGLQRLSAQPFDTVLMAVSEAVESPNPAVIISPDDWTYDDITLPVTFASEGEVSVQNLDESGQVGTVRLTPAVRAASLQTLQQDGRTLLVATSNGAATELDRLLAWLDADVARWQRLSGSAVLAIPGRAPVSVPLRTTTPTATPEEAEHDSDNAVIVGIAASAAALLVAGLGWMWWRRRRSREPA